MSRHQIKQPKDGIQRITIPVYHLVWGNNVKLHCDVVNNNFRFELPDSTTLTFHADELISGSVNVNEFMPLNGKEITISRIEPNNVVTIMATDPRFRNAGITQNLYRRYVVNDQFVTVRVH